MNGHAQYALDSAEAVERARKDFEAGGTTNPFPPSQDLQHGVYARAIESLTNRRDCLEQHDQSVCCWEHDRHIRGSWTRSQYRITSCPACEVEADIERDKRAKERSTND